MLFRSGEFPDDVKTLAIHTDVLDGVLRFVAAILDEDGVLPAEEFWALARATIEEHAADHPELAVGASPRAIEQMDDAARAKFDIITQDGTGVYRDIRGELRRGTHDG